MSTEPIPARVARGAALLDERLPGWVDRIDLDRLELRSGCNCILGQEFGGQEPFGIPYLRGVEKLFGRDAIGAARHGFDIDDDLDGEDTDEDELYDALNVEWKRVILARRAGAPS